MQDISSAKLTVAKNISALREKAGMTQFELAESLNYSDKAISKWERGNSIPDVFVLKQIADILGVTVDYLLIEHETVQPIAPNIKKHIAGNRIAIAFIAILGVWTLALLSFCIMWILNSPEWKIFVYALPVSLTVGVVFNAVWGKVRYTFLLVSALMWSVITMVYIIFLVKNWWVLFLLGLPLQLIIFLCFKIKKIPMK